MRTAALSLTLGVVALGVAASMWSPTSTSGRHGWIFTTVGLSAVAAGFRALRRAGDVRERSLKGGAVAGIVLGIAGTAVMIWAVLTPGTTPTASPSFHAGGSPVAQAVGRSDAIALRPTALPSAPVSTDPEELGPLLGGLVFQLNSEHESGWAWPRTLAEDSSHRVLGPDRVLQVLPADVAMQYLSSSDDSSYSIRLWLSADPSEYVVFDSNVGQIQRAPDL